MAFSWNNVVAIGRGLEITLKYFYLTLTSLRSHVYYSSFYGLYVVYTHSLQLHHNDCFYYSPLCWTFSFLFFMIILLAEAHRFPNFFDSTPTEVRQKTFNAHHHQKIIENLTPKNHNIRIIKFFSKYDDKSSNNAHCFRAPAALLQRPRSAIGTTLGIYTVELLVSLTHFCCQTIMLV